MAASRSSCPPGRVLPPHPVALGGGRDRSRLRHSQDRRPAPLCGFLVQRNETQRGEIVIALPQTAGQPLIFPHRVAALYVQPAGVCATMPDVDAWPEERDARTYTGALPVVAHPPCQRWGRFWHGSTAKPHQFKMGADGGCFAAALWSVRTWGGVIEHPADSNAWRWFGLTAPPRAGGWHRADEYGGISCYVEQGHYGHFARKPTWLYGVGIRPIDLPWGQLPQRIHPVALAKHGYEKARRIGMMAMVGGKDKTRIRDATPPDFARMLVELAASAGVVSP